MTKAQIAELIKISKGGGQENRDKFDARDAYAYIDIILPSIIEQVISENGGIDGSLLKTYENVPLMWNDTRKVVYITLPASIHNLTGDRGLHQIQPMESETDDQFVSIPSAAVPVYDQLEAGNWDGFDYYLEGEVVIFPKMSKLQATGFLKVKLIPATSSYGENEQLRIPGKYEEVLFQKVFAMMEPQNRNIQKETNDNNANTK